MYFISSQATCIFKVIKPAIWTHDNGYVRLERHFMLFSKIIVVNGINFYLDIRAHIILQHGCHAILADDDIKYMVIRLVR